MLPHITILKELCVSLKLDYTTSDTEPNLICVNTPHPHVFFKCVTPFNSDVFHVIAKNKHLTYSILKNKIMMPVTSILTHKDVVQDVTSVTSVLQQHTFPLVVKMNSGKMGQHVYKCTTMDQAQLALENIFDVTKENSDTIALVQEYIPFTAEYRVMVFRGKILFAYYKTYQDKKFTNDIDCSAYRENEIPVMIDDVTVLQRLQDFLQPLYKNMSFDFAGVDLLEDANHKLYLLELNTQPGLYNVLQHGGHNAVQHMYATMLQYLTHKKIGRREYVSFPQFNVRDVIAKIDTGAYSGCIHARVIGEVEREGKRVLQFVLLDTTHPELVDVLHETDMYRAKFVKNASGVVNTRYCITTQIVLAGIKLDVEIGLSDRTSMMNPVLIGRKILSGNFLVDVSGEFLANSK